MTTPLYLRPMGLFMRALEAEAVADPEAIRSFASLPLSNTGHHFTAVEMAERVGKAARRRLLTLDELFQRDWPQALELAATVERLTQPRPRFAGLPMDRPHIMGIVNVTPDSFSDGGNYLTAKDAVAHALRLEEEGAEFLDIGGESTRPGAAPVSLEEELARVMPVIEGLVGKTRCRLSIDTRKAEVMRRAASSGIHMLNDTSALTNDPRSLRVAVESRLPIVLMHAQGDPASMQRDPRYQNALLDVYDQLAARVDACVRAGITRERLIVDPGIGFGKTALHNIELLAGLSLFHGLGTGVLIGASRKSFIASLTGAVDPAERLPGSIAAALAGAMSGAQILRVHDVAATRQALTIWEAAMTGTASQLLPM
ncbi:MAG: dihydropteroate synthase [Hyphomicrobiaceae bacterium]